jgi:hypothetical protein
LTPQKMKCYVSYPEQGAGGLLYLRSLPAAVVAAMEDWPEWTTVTKTAWIPVHPDPQNQ